MSELALQQKLDALIKAARKEERERVIRALEENDGIGSNTEAIAVVRALEDT